jgi:metal-responsive CopG/Arc/MetJ family transcriptional regulator
MYAKVLISVPKSKLRKIDALARSCGKSRSAFVVDAAINNGAKPQYARPIDDPAVRRAVKVIEDSRKHWKPGPSAEAMIREMRDRAKY